MERRSLGHRAPLLWLVLPLIAGLAFGKSVTLGAVVPCLAVAALAAVGAVAASWRNSRWWAPLLLVAMTAAGASAYALHRARLPAWETLPPREARMAVRVDRVFVQGDKKRTSGLGVVVSADPHLRDLVGQRLYFSLALRGADAAPIRSAMMSTVGVLVTLPAHPPANSFDGYLAGAGINFKLTRGRMIATLARPSAYYRFCAAMSGRFKAILGHGIFEKRPALTGLLRAMMLGETHELSDEQQTLFMQSGTMHLFAISGLNIAVIAGTIEALLLLLRLPPWARFTIGTALLWLFVDITGAAPSAVRAFIMATFVQAALVIHRPANSLAAVAASALFVVLVAPLQVFSASFLMSYGIVVALLVLGLPLGEKWAEHTALWRDVPRIGWGPGQRAIAHAWHGFVTTLAIGVATTLMSLLTGVQFFGLLTPGALVANLVLIPAAMAATVAGFVSVLCGLVGFSPGAFICNHAAALVLLVIETLVRWSVTLPGAYLPARFSPPELGAVATLTLLAALLAGYAANWRTERGGWWPPFALVALVLIFGVKFGN